MSKVYTGVYWPAGGMIMCPGSVYWQGIDTTTVWNNMASVESPSYCVRLLVFEMPED